MSHFNVVLLRGELQMNIWLKINAVSYRGHDTCVTSAGKLKIDILHLAGYSGLSQPGSKGRDKQGGRTSWQLREVINFNKTWNKIEQNTNAIPATGEGLSPRGKQRMQDGGGMLAWAHRAQVQLMLLMLLHPGWTPAILLQRQNRDA